MLLADLQVHWGCLHGFVCFWHPVLWPWVGANFVVAVIGHLNLKCLFFFYQQPEWSFDPWRISGCIFLWCHSLDEIEGGFIVWNWKVCRAISNRNRSMSMCSAEGPVRYKGASSCRPWTSSTAQVNPDPGWCFSKVHRSFSGFVRNVMDVFSKQPATHFSTCKDLQSVYFCVHALIFFSILRKKLHPQAWGYKDSELRMQDKQS